MSTGYDHVADGALWRCIAVKETWKQPWPMWGRGVVDLRPLKPMVAGKLLRHAIREVVRVVNMTACEHKIGMCRCPHERFMSYQASDAPWQPWLMCLLGSTSTREGSWLLEASLILAIEVNLLNIANNVNWTTSCDYGGEGPRAREEARAEHFVYLALKPLHVNQDSGCISPSVEPTPLLHHPIGRINPGCISP